MVGNKNHTTITVALQDIHPIMAEPTVLVSLYHGSASLYKSHPLVEMSVLYLIEKIDE
jgi:hypothetical protein